MDPIDLEPRYTKADIPGQCLKCLAEQKLDGCLRLLLTADPDNEEMQTAYLALYSFLTSPESKDLRDRTERYLADGRDVKVRVRFEGGEVKCDLVLDET